MIFFILFSYARLFSLSLFTLFPTLFYLSLFLHLSLFSLRTKFLRTFGSFTKRERIYRSIARRPRSCLLLLLEVRSRLARFSFLPSSSPFSPREFLSFSSRHDLLRTASLRRRDTPHALAHAVVDSHTRLIDEPPTCARERSDARRLM